MEPQETHQHAPSENVSTPVTSDQNTTAGTQTNTLAAAIVTSAAMIAIALVIALHPHAAANAGTAQPAAQQPAVAPDISKVNITGEPFIGNANAPVTIAYWFDYQCPFCRQDEQTALPQIITNYVTTGKVKIVFKDFAFLGPDSQTVGIYARAVWAAAPDQFYAWHKAIFDTQGKEGSGWASQAKIASITQSTLGVTTAAKVAQLVQTNGATYQKAIDADKAEAQAFGIDGTPATLIGTQVITGAQPYANFDTAIKAALKTK